MKELYIQSHWTVRTMLGFAAAAAFGVRAIAQQGTQLPSPEQLQVLIQQAELSAPLPASAARIVGLFYSAQFTNRWMPLPTDVLNLPFWVLGDGLYLFDD